MEKKINWYVVYTKPRWEKKIAKTLDDKGVEAYCPLNKVYRQWTDRKKIVYEPLFKGYLFLHLRDDEKWEIKKHEGILNFVYWNGKPAIVRDEEIETIQKFLSDFPTVEVENLKIDVRDEVKVKRGTLMNYHGIVLEVVGSKAKVRIESMGLQLIAVFDKKNLEPI